MQISDIFYCVLLTITISTSCADGESRNQHQKHELYEERGRRQVVKRDAAIIIDHFPIQPFLKYRPKFFYKRISNPRYIAPKPAFGITRTKHRSAKPSRKVMRKYRKSVNPKYCPPGHYKRPPKILYANQKSQNYKPLYGGLKRSPNYYDISEPVVGFGEPPSDYLPNYHFPKTTYGEPPLDADPHATSVSYLPTHALSDPIDLNNQDFPEQEKKVRKSIYKSDFDSHTAAQVKRPSFTIPKPKHEKPLPPEDDNKQENKLKMDVYNKKKRKQKRAGITKAMTRPLTPEDNVRRHAEDQIVVGGRYAEPPARYVPSFYSNAPEMADDEDFAPPEAVDPDVTSSATNSPYVNYKHSNVAFSPQNLNDAFSIVD